MEHRLRARVRVERENRAAALAIVAVIDAALKRRTVQRAVYVDQATRIKAVRAVSLTTEGVNHLLRPCLWIERKHRAHAVGAACLSYAVEDALDIDQIVLRAVAV